MATGEKKSMAPTLCRKSTFNKTGPKNISLVVYWNILLSLNLAFTDIFAENVDLEIIVNERGVSERVVQKILDRGFSFLLKYLAEMTWKQRSFFANPSPFHKLLSHVLTMYALQYF